jgi:L-threonylcarbamoyladenylate synthase
LRTVQQQIRKALETLRSGGLIAYPTDTVYGLGADATNEDAVRKVFRVKSRPLTMALPILLADMDMLHAATQELPDSVSPLAERFWPGALTLIVRKSLLIPDIVTAGAPTVAVRIPNHPTPRALAKGLGKPLVGTSANRSGQPSETTAHAVQAQLRGDVDIVVSGQCKGGVESTILDLTQRPPRIVRAGPVTKEAIEGVIGKVAA